jgi:chromosome segregation ATPase
MTDDTTPEGGQIDKEGVAFCTHCAAHRTYVVGSEEQTEAGLWLAKHAAECGMNPLAQQLAAQSSRLRSLEQELVTERRLRMEDGHTVIKAQADLASLEQRLRDLEGELRSIKAAIDEQAVAGGNHRLLLQLSTRLATLIGQE